MATKTSTKEDTKKENDELTKEEARAVYEPIFSHECERFLHKISSLYHNPPQVLHIEGGSKEERIAFAHYFAALFICEEKKDFHDIKIPCMECANCYKVAARIHADVPILRKEEENEDLHRDFKIENSIRPLKTLVKENPRFANKRIVILQEAEALEDPSANALLKVLEEPSSHTVFVFTTSQRERMLPTLISRGFVLTLPWQNTRLKNEIQEEWEPYLADFFRYGTNIFNKTSTKGAIDGNIATCIISLIQKSLSRAIIENENPLQFEKSENLATIFKSLPKEAFFEANDILAEAVEALKYHTNTTYIVEAFLTKIFRLFPR